MKKRREPGGLALAEDAFLLLRHATVRDWLLYLCGTGPFLAVLLRVTADCAMSGGAVRRLTVAAPLLAVLYLWMKVRQGVFSRRLEMLHAGTAGEPTPVRLAGFFQQAAWQGLALPVLALSLILVFPVPALEGFFLQLEAAASAPEPRPLREMWRDAWRAPRECATFWWMVSPWAAAIPVGGGVFLAAVSTGGNADLAEWRGVITLVCIALLLQATPVAAAVLINCGLLIAVLPELYRILTGSTPLFTMAGARLLNPVFFLSTFSLAYLVLDPLRRAGHVLRQFRAAGRASGEDLLVRFRRMVPGALSICLLMTPWAFTVRGAEPAEGARFEDAVRETLAQPEFDWRVPPGERQFDGEVPGFLERFVQSIQRVIDRLVEWLGRLSPDPGPVPSGGTAMAGLAEPILWILAVGLALALLYWLAVTLLRMRRPPQPTPQADAAPPPPPDLRAPDLAAEQLPGDEWLALAERMRAQGEWRLACRALHLAGLAYLGAAGIIRLARHKSVGDYQREVRKRAAALPDLAGGFPVTVRVFEGLWFGDEPASADGYTRMADHARRCRSLVRA